MFALTASFASATMPMKRSGSSSKHVGVFSAHEFPSFLPKQVENIKDTFARNLATRIERLPVPVCNSFTLPQNITIILF